jgi:hypothetical protein
MFYRLRAKMFKLKVFFTDLIDIGDQRRAAFSKVAVTCKEVQIVYRLFLVNCYLLHVYLGFLPSHLAAVEVE